MSKQLSRKEMHRRARIMTGIVVAVFLILVLRLAYLQIAENEHYRTLARENSMRLIGITPPRGEIYDRHGEKIVGNRPLYVVQLINVGLSDAELNQVINRLSVILSKPPEEIRKQVDSGALRRFEPVHIAKDVSMDVVTRIEEERDRLPGVVIDMVPMRDYPHGNMLAHALGYVREISASQLERYRDQGYRMGDMFGQEGLERTFEKYLRGERGAWQVEVDAYGNPIRNVGMREPIPGHNLELTIDYRVQKAAEEGLARVIKMTQDMGYEECNAGAAVAIDPRTGEVLALASYPAYDPGMFAGNLSPADADRIINAPDRPFLNRAIQSAYPPGSTYKMITAIAALESGQIDPDFSIWDEGYYYLHRLWPDWTYPRGHGRVDVKKALAVSCDTFFWRLGNIIGWEPMVRWSRAFGLGEKTGIELLGEDSGVVPDAEYKRKVVQAMLDARFGPQFKALETKYNLLLAAATDEEERTRIEKERDREKARLQAKYDDNAWELKWRYYDTLNMSIGQGYNLYTPIQLANYVAQLANGGTRYKPFLVKRVTTYDGKVVEEFEPQVQDRAEINPKTLDIVRQGMLAVTQPGGTAYGVFHDFPILTAGKTGTAENYRNGVKQPAHGLYVAFAPYDNPQIAIAVIVEHGVHGSSTAAVVAKDMMAAYFNIPINRTAPIPVSE